MEASELRPTVLEVLRRQPETQFVQVEHDLRELVPTYDSRDMLKVRDILWELLVQGVLAPGYNSSNLDLPFIHLTDYGKDCLRENVALPHDPDGYLARLQQPSAEPLDSTVLSYVTESLQTFLHGHYMASAVMLGVASERCLDLLTEAYSASIADSTDKAAFQKALRQAGRSIKQRFDVLRQRLLALALPADLQDALDVQLSGVFTLIRYSRNDAGHPTGRTVDRSVAHGNLLLFPQYCTRVYALMSYFAAHQV